MFADLLKLIAKECSNYITYVVRVRQIVVLVLG